MALQIARGPWDTKDHDGKGLKIVDRDGNPICFLHYPDTVEKHATARAILETPMLLEKLKDLIGRLTFMSQRVKVDWKKDPLYVAAQSVVDSIENPKPRPEAKPAEEL